MNKLVSEGKSIIFISHKMREVLHILDRITILRLGEIIGTVNAKEVTGPDLAAMMIGKKLAESQYEKVESEDEVVAKLSNIDYDKKNKHNGLNNISMEIRRGEIVGIAGVDGNGQTQLAQILTGIITPQSGTLDIKGKKNKCI